MKNNMDALLKPEFIEYNAAEFKSFSFLPTIKYRDVISDICSDLPKIHGIKYFYLIISSNFSKTICLGNHPHWSLTYHKYNLGRLDVGISSENEQFFVLTELMQKDYLVDLFYKWFETYGVYETYTIIRQSEDVKISAIAHHDQRIINPAHYYDNTVSAFEDFTIIFIDNMLDIIKSYCPALALTPFILDSDYRKDIIKKKIKIINPILSLREKEVLVCAFHGYSSKEIAKILPLDNRTIEKYLANAKKKLGAKNITHAIKKAIDFGIINR